jgi:uncharacterized protein YdcH (DUF465 family)
MSAQTHTHRANIIHTIDSAWHFTAEGDPLMENHPEEIKAHLMATSEEFRDLASRHAQYHQQLEALESKHHLTDEEQMEEVRLKKQKLRLKDQMNELLARERQHVA